MNITTRELLKSVSRSFYISLMIVPHRVRDIFGLAFLCCKIADTIADTKLIDRAKRRESLEAYRQAFSGESLMAPALDVDPEKSAEAKLLAAVAHIFSEVNALPKSDRLHLHWLLPELTRGMITDLEFFGEDAKTLKALPDDASLRKYTYAVAGCVGRFWTRVLKDHFHFAQFQDKSTEEIGEELGHGLQLVNILRDLPRDLRQGRLYLPQTSLQKANLTPEDLLNPKKLSAVKPFLQSYIDRARHSLAFGEEYIARIPWYARRLRAAVDVPMRLGIQTLDLLESSPHWLSPESPIKVSRSRVYWTLARSLLS